MKSAFRQPDPDPAATEAKRRMKQMTGDDRCIRCDGVNGEHEYDCPTAKMIREMADKERAA